MSEQVVVALKITTDAKTGGISATIGSLQDLERGSKKASSELDKLSSTLSKKFSASDIGKSVLGGLGLGSGFAVAQQAASLIVGYWQRAAEHAKFIADQSDRQLEAVRQRISLERTPSQNLDELIKQQAKDQEELANLNKERFVTRTIGSTVRGEDLRRQVTSKVELTDVELRRQAELGRLLSERANVIKELELRIKATADAERALLSEEVKHAQAVKAINDQVGTAGLSRAEADARIAQLNRERMERDGKKADDSQATRIARAEAEQKGIQKIRNALAEQDATLDSQAEAYRKIADPQRQYQLQLAEIDRLMGAVSASGQPFLSQQAGAAAKARILAEMNDTAGKAIRATRQEVEKYDIALSILEKNPALSDQEKQRERIRLIDEQTAAIKRAKDALTEFMAANPGVDTAALTSALQALGDKGARNAGAVQPAQTLAQRDAIALRDLSDPSKHYQDAAGGAAGGGSQFLAGLGTQADNVAQMIDGGLNAALGETSNFLYNFSTGAMSFREAWNGAILAVGQNFLRMTTDMVAKMIWRSTVERALTWLGVTTHLTGEAAKTTGTGIGAAKRLAMVAKEALADVYHGAVAAFKALAGIPIIGPVLGAAALAGALALGVGLVSKIGGHKDGGIVQGGRQLSWLNEEGTEAVIRAPSVRRFGASFLSGLNDGILNLDALPGNIAAQLPGAADQVQAAASRGSGGGSAAGGRDRRIIMLAPDLVSARQMARDPEFENVIVDVMRRRRGEVLES